MEENKVIETLERIEKKQNTLLESMSVVLNYFLAESVKQNPEDEEQKEELNHRMQTLLIFRDECMELVHGEKYIKHMDGANKEIVEDIIKDILGNILK
nr:MAG TPA: hypothetical protein [Caudoviricetes sp.]